MSGIASLKYALDILNIHDLSTEIQHDVLKEVKSLGQKGKVVELNELPDIVAFTKQNSKQKQIKIK